MHSLWFQTSFHHRISKWRCEVNDNDSPEVSLSVAPPGSDAHLKKNRKTSARSLGTLSTGAACPYAGELHSCPCTGSVHIDGGSIQASNESKSNRSIQKDKQINPYKYWITQESTSPSIQARNGSIKVSNEMSTSSILNYRKQASNFELQ